VRVLSGIQPTGALHLGNYFGALAHWIKLQNEGHESVFFIANQHAITLPQERETLKKNTLELAASFLAVGIDPQKSIIFVQSDVPAHAQLTWILSSLAPMGLMERQIQFKEKSEKEPGGASLGLFSYPVLQAADILLYKADLIPVGIDQAQHLELTRELARKFNNKYKPIFPEPKTMHTKTTKVVGLDGRSKMSKSYNNYVGITESEESIWQKLSKAVTDTARIKKSDPGNPDICNIFSIHKLFSPDSDLEWSSNGCRKAEIGCIECKKKLFENMKSIIGPIREKYEKLIQNPDKIKAILADGAKRANAIANKTLDEVYDLVGF